VPGGTYDVEVDWVAYANRATNATYKVHDGSTLLATVSENQQVAPAGTVTYDSIPFQSLGHFTIDSGALKVVLTDNANGYVIADAMYTAPVGALGSVTQNTYDQNGNLVTTTDGDGNVTTYVYDADNRQTVTIDALTKRTTEMLDAVGNLTEMKDASNNVTTFAYDADNRKTSATNPMGYTGTFSYDAVGNLTSSTDYDGWW
jgi:YD repeat-containing protein